MSKDQGGIALAAVFKRAANVNRELCVCRSSGNRLRVRSESGPYIIPCVIGSAGIDRFQSTSTRDLWRLINVGFRGETVAYARQALRQNEARAEAQLHKVVRDALEAGPTLETPESFCGFSVCILEERCSVCSARGGGVRASQSRPALWFEPRRRGQER